MTKGVRLGDMLRGLLGTLREHGMARRKGVVGGNDDDALLAIEFVVS